MTRKDYIIIAEALKKVKPYDENSLKNEPYNNIAQSLFLDVVDSLREELEKDIKKFDAGKFYDYIGVYQHKL